MLGDAVAVPLPLLPLPGVVLTIVNDSTSRSILLDGSEICLHQGLLAIQTRGRLRKFAFVCMLVVQVIKVCQARSRRQLSEKPTVTKFRDWSKCLHLRPSTGQREAYLHMTRCGDENHITHSSRCSVSLAMKNEDVAHLDASQLVECPSACSTVLTASRLSWS